MKNSKFWVFLSYISKYHALSLIILHTCTHNTWKPYTYTGISVYLDLFLYINILTSGSKVDITINLHNNNNL